MRRSSAWLRAWWRAALFGAVLPLRAVLAADPTPDPAPSTAPAPRPRNADAQYEQLRGLEQLPKEGSPAQTLARALLFVPRTALDALTYSMAFGAYVGAESDVPVRLQEILTFGHSPVGIHPLLSLSSGSRTEYGAEIAYRRSPLGAALAGLYGDIRTLVRWGLALAQVAPPSVDFHNGALVEGPAPWQK